MEIKKLLVLLIVFIVIVVCVMMIISKDRDSNHDIRYFTSKNGTEGEYLIYPVKDAKGVLVWLHGDGAYEFKHPNSKAYLEGENGIKKVAREKHLTLVVPKTIAKDETWWKNGIENTQYLVELISSLPNHEKLWIGSFSGGSETTTYWLLKRLPDMKVKSGGAVLFGGGGSPKKEKITHHVEKKQVVKGHFPLTWIVGEHDTGGGKDEDDPFNAFTTSKEGEDFYRNQGWDTKRIVAPGYEHLLIKDDIGQYGKYLREHIQ